MSDATWISLHLFHRGDLDRVLVEVVEPTLAALERQGAISGAFFLRYWNGGPHLRLRLATAPERAEPLAESLRVALQASLATRAAGAYEAEAYAERAGAIQVLEERVRRPGAPDAEAVEPLQPPDSVQTRVYRFDAARYGGDEARRAVELHFCRSSRLALTIVRHTRQQMGSRMTLALHLAAAAPAALGATPRRAHDLFTRLGEVVRLFGSDEPLATLEPSPEELAALVHQLRHGLPLVDQSSDVTRLVSWWQAELAAQAAQAGARAGFLVMDYVHLLNNRLGLGVRAECQLYRWVARALESLC